MAETVRLELVVVDKTSAALTKTKKNVEGINNSLGRLAILAAGAFSVGALTRYANTVQEVTNRLKLVTTGQENLNKTFVDLQNVANRSRGDLEGVVDLYSKIALSTKDLQISQATTSRITETFAKTLAISGASAQGSAGAIRQFGQALASGAFRGDEFNSVVEAAPLILDILANETGKARGEIRALASQGKLTADVLINALVKNSKMVDEQFAKTSVTIGQATTVLQNNFLALGRSAGPLFTSIGKAILVVANNLETAITFALSFGASLAVGKVILMTRAVGGLTGGLKKLQVVMMRNPLLLLATAAAAAITAIYTLLKPILQLEGALSVKLLFALEKFANGFINAFQGLGNVALEFGGILFEAITNALRLKDPRDAFKDFGGKMKSAFQEAFDDGGPFKFVSDKDRKDLEAQLKKLQADIDGATGGDEPITITPKVDEDKARKELEKAMTGLSNVAKSLGGVFDDTFGTSYVKEMAVLEDARQRDLIDLKQYHDMVATLERKAALAKERARKQEVQDAIKLVTAGKFKEVDLIGKTEDQKKAIAIGAGKEALDVLAQNNEKAFQLQKALAVAQALLDAKNIIMSFSKAGAIFGPIGAALGAAAGVAFTAAQIAAIKSATYSGPRQRGGMVGPGQSVLVGEAGREVFQPNTAGRIIPNDQLGGSVNINFTINAIDSQGIDQVLVDRRQTIIGVVNEALNRKGRVGITN